MNGPSVLHKWEQIVSKVTVGDISLVSDFKIQSSLAEFFHKACFPIYFKD